MKCGVSPLNDTKYCQECGSPTTEKQEICINCGIKLVRGRRVITDNIPKSPGTATLLSCLIPGLGQIYLGQLWKGIAIIIGQVILSIISGGVLSIPIWIAVMIDAYRIGTKLNQGKVVSEWEFF